MAEEGNRADLEGPCEGVWTFILKSTKKLIIYVGP